MSHTAFTTRFKPLLLAGLLATAGFGALAQAPTPPAGTTPPAQRGMMHPEHRADPARMEARMAKHQAELKARLKIEPAQEAAWATWTAAMKPPADMRQNREAMHAEMQKLTTPERIDRMKAMRATRDAQMDKHAQATKDFYAALNAEQKKTFDTSMMRGHRGGHGKMHGGMGGMHEGMHGKTQGSAQSADHNHS
jgi:periplasmic protein CpxP/Spy